MKHKQATIQVKSRSKDGGRIIISTAQADRDRDRVFPRGAQLDNYRNNPVVLFGHDYHSPFAVAGRTTDLQVSDEGITADFELRPAANEADPQNVIRLLWEQDFIRTASIGFQPIAAAPNDLGGLDFTSWELLEWSLVPVPANQGALALAAKSYPRALQAYEQRRAGGGFDVLKLAQALGRLASEVDRQAKNYEITFAQRDRVLESIKSLTSTLHARFVPPPSAAQLLARTIVTGLKGYEQELRRKRRWQP